MHTDTHYTGKGIGIAFLDTGISAIADFTKPINRIVAFVDFLYGRTQPYDDNGHGTHVAGIACGNGWYADGRYCGAAPQAHIIALKILDAYGQGTSARAIRAMRWIMDNAAKYNIKVVNLSIGTNDRKIHVPLVEAVDALWQKGIVVTAAAANPDGGVCFSPPPLISPNVLSVGTWEDQHYFAALAGKRFAAPVLPDVWAHGENIISALSPDYNFSLPNRSTNNIIDGHYIAMSGASMATPLVSGIAACLLEQSPHLTPAQVKAYLCAQAQQHGGLLTPALCQESFASSGADAAI